MKERNNESTRNEVAKCMFKKAKTGEVERCDKALDRFLKLNTNEQQNDGYKYSI